MQREVAWMARRVALTALAVGLLLFAVRLPTGQGTVSSFVFALGVMVALVPEGLPATLSVSLALGVRRMARHQALVKKFVAVEALGSTTVVCTDKTGTLTQAEMTVVRIWTWDDEHAVTGVGYEPAGQVSDPEPVRELLRSAALCSDARLLPPVDGARWRVLGDTTEGALLVAAAKAGLDMEAEEAAAPRTGEHPFDSVRRLMSTVHEENGAQRIRVKGAPLEVLNRCTRLHDGAALVELTGTRRAKAAAVARFGARLVVGDASEAAVQERAGAAHADLVVAATGRDEDNLVVGLLAKRRFAVPRVVARVNDDENSWLFDPRWGVDSAVPAAAHIVSLIEEATGAADTVALLRLSSAGVGIIATAITAGSKAAGRTLGDVELPEGTLVATIVRNGDPTVPTPETVLRHGDELLLVSLSAGEEEIHAAFQ